MSVAPGPHAPIEGETVITNHIAVRLLLLVAAAAAAAMAQSASPVGSTAAPAVPALKVGMLNVQEAVFGCDEGQKELAALNAKFASATNQIKALGEEVDKLRKQLEVQGPKMGDSERAELANQIESKQNSLGRQQQYNQGEYMEQQNAIARRILRKLLLVVEKYARENGIAKVEDSSKEWPEGPTLWNSPSIDITKLVVEIYNTQSRAAAAPASSGAPAHQPASPVK